MDTFVLLNSPFKAHIISNLLKAIVLTLHLSLDLIISKSHHFQAHQLVLLNLLKCVLLMSPMCLQSQREPKPLSNVKVHFNPIYGNLIHAKIQLNVLVLIKIFALYIHTSSNRVLVLCGTPMDQPIVKVT